MTGAAVHAIVLNWNGESDTAACLESLLAQRGVTLEILLVDNASDDGSGERLRNRYPRIAYLQTGANLGYAGGNNLGIDWALARGAAWLLVVNNDTVADPECVRRLLEAAASDARIAALSPLITRFDDPHRVWFAGGRFDRARAIGSHDHENERLDVVLGSDDESGALIRTCSFLSGCCLLLRARAIEDAGHFRADFFAYMEDVDLSLRLTESGWRLGWVPAARLAHRVPLHGTPPSPMQILLRDRNRRRFVRAHYSPAWRIVFAFWFYPTRMIHLARYTLTGDWSRARAVIAGMREP